MIKIGENIKRLRLTKNITQEKLADFLHISFQTVSKWERGECFPDIGLLVPIANYFAISTDELLGADAAKNEAKIKEFLDEFERLANLGMYDEKVLELTQQAYRDFPNDWRVIDKYIYATFASPKNWREDSEFAWSANDRFIGDKEEFIRLCEDILERCNISEIRYNAIHWLATIYSHTGEKTEKILEITEQLPHTGFTKNIVRAGIICDNKYSREAIQETTQSLIVIMKNLIQYDNSLSFAEQAKAFEDIINLAKIVYGENKIGFMNCQLSELHLMLCFRFWRNNEFERGFNALETSLDYAVRCDNLKENQELDGVFVRGIIYEPSKTHNGFKGNWMSSQFALLREKFGESEVEKMERFKAIVAKYEPFVHDVK